MAGNPAKARSGGLFSLLALLCLFGFVPMASAQTYNLQGAWSGARVETNPPTGLPANSNVVYALYQASGGSSVVGTIGVYWPGTSYYWSGALSGTISGSTLSLTWTPEIVNLPSGASACGETESLTLATSGGVTTATVPGYHPCGDATRSLATYAMTLVGWQHLGCSPCGPGPRSGIPIDPSTGNVTDTETDYTTSGMNPLSFSRYYNSLNPITTYAGTMGTQWRTTYDRYLQVGSSTVIAERPNGDQITFNLVGSTWTPSTDVDMTLTSSGSTWTLTGHDDSVETYTVSGAKGTLNSIALRNGYTQTLTYTSGLLSSVTDSYSRSLGLSYTSGLLTQVTTPDSLVLTYGYNGASTLLTTVSYNTSPATSQTYNYANASFPTALTSITDENSHTWKTFTYDSYGRSTAAEMIGTSTATAMAYNDTTAARTETNPLGQTHTYQLITVGGGTYNRIAGMTRIADGTVLGASSAYLYDTNGYTSQLTDYKGNVTTYTNNSHGDPTSITEAYGTAIARTTTITYDATWVHLPDSIVTPGVTASFTYDASGNPLTVKLTDTTTQSIPYSTNGQTRTWTYTYDATGHVLTAKTPNSNTTTFTYDSSGRMTGATNALSQAVTVSSLTAGGLPLTVVDANSVTTTFTYSTRNWLLTKDVDSTGGAYTTTNTYDAAGNLTKAQAPDASYLTNTYDNQHRLTQTADSFSNSINYTLDALGNATATKYENPSSTVTRSLSAAFDALGRQTQYTGGVTGENSYYTYDSNNNLTSYENPGNDTFTYTIDALNRVSKNALPIASANINYTFDAHDRPLTVVDPKGNTTSYVYDGFGDTIQVTSPDTGTTVYTYDSDGNLTKKVDALSIETDYTWDALDRLLTRTYPADTSENVAYTYDQTGTGFSNGIGRLTSLTDEAGSLTLTYDTRGNELSETRVNGTTTLTTTYTYDAASRVLTITYPDSSLVTYTRDAMGKITSLTDKPSGGTATTIASSITYEPFGLVSGFTYGNGVTYAPTLDADYRMTALVENGSGSTHIQNLSYPLKATGQPTQAYDNLNYLNGFIDITYDGMSQMNQFYVYATSTLIYPTYDKNSNRNYYANGSGTSGITNVGLNSGTNQIYKLFTGSSGTTLFNTFTTDSDGRITAFSPGYGSAAVTGLSYNNAGELASVSGSGGTLGSYIYDGAGQRFSKTVGSTTTMFQYSSGGTLLAEASGASETNYIYMNGRPVAMLTGTTFTWLHGSNIGTPQVATNSSQSIVGKWNYLPFGEPNGSSGSFTQNLRFPGQYYDAESAFHHNGARDYVPSLGRYLEPDPLGIYDLGTGAGINPYTYAGQDPMHTIDPSGLAVGLSTLQQQATGSRHAPECTVGYYEGEWWWEIKSFPLDGTVQTTPIKKFISGDYNHPAGCPSTAGDTMLAADGPQIPLPQNATPQVPVANNKGLDCTCPPGTTNYAPRSPYYGTWTGAIMGGLEGAIVGGEEGAAWGIKLISANPEFEPWGPEIVGWSMALHGAGGAILLGSAGWAAGKSYQMGVNSAPGGCSCPNPAPAPNH